MYSEIFIVLLLIAMGCGFSGGVSTPVYFDPEQYDDILNRLKRKYMPRLKRKHITMEEIIEEALFEYEFQFDEEGVWSKEAWEARWAKKKRRAVVGLFL